LTAILRAVSMISHTVLMLSLLLVEFSISALASFKSELLAS